MNDSTEPSVAGGGFDPTADRYPTLGEALSKIRDAIDDDQLVVERVEVTALANGEANCRWWEARAEEPDFVHVPDPTGGAAHS